MLEKKLLFVVDEFIPVRGAPSVRINSFIEELEDFKIYVVGGWLGKARKPKNCKLYPVKVPSMSHFLKFLIFLLTMNCKAVWRAFLLRPDVTIISVPKYELLWSARIIKIFSKRLVIDLRDSFKFLDYPAYFRHFFPNFIAVPFGKLVSNSQTASLRSCVKLPDLITTANKSIGKEFGEKVRVVSNGVDTDLFKPKHRRSKKLNLVYVGNFSEKDKFEFMYKTLPLFQGKVVLNLIGGGRNKYKIISKLKKLKVDYKDHGFVAHEELPKLLNSMDVGFIFRQRDVDASIPVSIYEYASMNIPTLTNSVGIMSKFVEKNKLGFVVSSEVEVKEILTKMIKTPRILERYYTLHDLSVRKFSRKKQAKKFRDLILNLLDK